MKINDFGQIQTDFDRLTEEIDKSVNGITTSVVVMEPNEVIPLVVVRALVKIEDAINETQQEVKDKKKTLSK